MPKTSENFNHYDRARTLERHDKQIKASMALGTVKEGHNTKPSKVIPNQTSTPLAKKTWQVPHQKSLITAPKHLLQEGVGVGAVVPLII